MYRPVRTKLMCSIKFFVKQIENREKKLLENKHDVVPCICPADIMRTKDFMITYLKWRFIVQQSLHSSTEFSRATIAGWFLKLYRQIELLDLSKWESVG